MKHSKTELRHEEWLPIFLIAAFIFILYQVTFSQVPTSDGYTWIRNIDSHDWINLFLPNHLLSEFIILILRHFCRFLIKSIHTLDRKSVV